MVNMWRNKKKIAELEKKLIRSERNYELSSKALLRLDAENARLLTAFNNL